MIQIIIIQMNRVNLKMDRFVSKGDDKVSKLASETVGLVHLDQFQKIKETSLTTKKDTSGGAGRAKVQPARLSFAVDDDEDEEDGDDGMILAKRARIMANPDTIVDDRKHEEVTLTESAQPQVSVMIRLNCSFFDGTDHRFVVEAPKSATIREILERARTAYPPLKGALVSSLMLVKENVILPEVCD